MYPQKVLVWCGVWNSGAIGPYFFENARSDAVTENGERYVDITNNYFWHQLQEICDSNDDVDMVDKFIGDHQSWKPFNDLFTSLVI